MIFKKAYNMTTTLFTNFQVYNTVLFTTCTLLHHRSLELFHLARLKVYTCCTVSLGSILIMRQKWHFSKWYILNINPCEYFLP